MVIQPDVDGLLFHSWLMETTRIANGNSLNHPSGDVFPYNRARPAIPIVSACCLSLMICRLSSYPTLAIAIPHPLPKSTTVTSLLLFPVDKP